MKSNINLLVRAFGIRSKCMPVLLVLVFVALGSYYSLTTPIFETPDEVWHYQVVREIATNHGLPVVDPNTSKPFAHEGLQPPLYYIMGAVLIAWMNPSDLATVPAPNPFVQIGQPEAGTNDNRNAFVHMPDEAFPYHGAVLAIHLLRLYSVLLGAVTVIFTYLLGLEFVKRPGTPEKERSSGQVYALLAACFVAFLPQFLFISGAINNDNLATALSAICLWMVVRMWRRGVTFQSAIVLGVLIGCALLAKLSAAALLPLALGVIGIWTIRQHAWRTGIQAGLALGAVAVLVGGWIYVRNWMLYGDPFAWGVLAQLVGARAEPPDLVRWLLSESEGLRLSAWGVFGWFNIRAASWFYFLFDALAVLGLVGMMYAVLHRKISFRTVIVFIWFLGAVVALWRYSSLIFSTQGRLLFPALPAYAVLWAWGLSTLIPIRLSRRVVGLLQGVMLIVSILTPSLFISPAYVPTTIDASSSWADNGLARFDNGIEWLGATVAPTSACPGESLRVTIYERVPSGLASSTAIFVHVLNSADVIVAQRDSYIGDGNGSALQGTNLITEDLQVPIPMTVPGCTTSQWRVEAGVYNAADGRRSMATTPLGQSLGDSVGLVWLNVESGDTRTYEFNFAGYMHLTGIDMNGESLKAGQSLTLTFHWQFLNPPAQYHLFVHALGKNDHIWAAVDSPIDGTGMTQVQLPFDSATPPDVYSLEVGVYQPPDNRLGVYDASGKEIGDRIFIGPVRVY